MASQRGWSTATLVKLQLKLGSPFTGLSDSEIEDFINNAEGYVEAILKLPSTFTFSASKVSHLMIRDLVTKRAALDVLKATPASFLTLQYTALMANLLIYDIEKTTAMLLTNGSIVDFIEAD